MSSVIAHMGPPGSSSGDGPESSEEIDIPGFPKALSTKQSSGFAATLQGHLEKLTANASSISHVLKALCGGLDRLEHKIDNNASQMEVRLANIVHHVTGEADEDTMSAWGSLGTASPVGDAPPARRRSSFALGLQGAAFSEGPIFELDGIGEESPEKHEPALATLAAQLAAQASAVVRNGVTDEKVRTPTESEPLGETKGDAPMMRSKDIASAHVPQHTTDQPVVRHRETVLPLSSGRRRSNQDDQSQGSGRSDLQDIPGSPAPDNEGVINKKARLSDERNAEQKEEGGLRPDDTGVSNKAARLSDDDAGFFNVPAHAAEPGAEGEIELEESIGSAADVHYIARQRWLWAFGRVCNLIRRRKRKQLEIMSQRATDRTVRMGSRVSVLEKRLDETKEALAGIERLRAKSTAHAYEMKCLSAKVSELSPLAGVEERIKRLVEVTQTRVEGMVKTGDSKVESKLRSGHAELESRLENDIKQHSALLEDMDDRYARSEDAMRRAEDRLGEMQDEVNTVTQSIVELERQLRVDEDRLDSLEVVKKAQQRRLSELRKKVGEGGVPPAEHEHPEETATDRMARLLKAAATGLEFLSSDLDKIAGIENGVGEHTDSEAYMVDGKRVTLELLRAISDDASDYASRCRQDKWDAGDGEGGRAENPVTRAEALCGHIEAALSLPKPAGEGVTHPSFLSPTPKANGVTVANTRRSSPSEFDGCSLDDIQCPNGRSSLAEKLKAARDVLLPIVEQQTSLGALKVAVLGLKADLRMAIGEANGIARRTAWGEEGSTHNNGEAPVNGDESRWQNVEGQIAALNTEFAGIRDSMFDRGLAVGRDPTVGEAGVGVIDDEDLEERLLAKANVSWVQRELQRLWEALNSRAVVDLASNSLRSSSREPLAVRPASAPLHERPVKENPETAGEESDTSRPSTPVMDGGKASAGMEGAGVKDPSGRMVLPHGDIIHRPSFHEGSPLIKDLLRKTSRLDQQMSSKADNEEVTRALSAIGNKLRKISSSIPGLEDALSNKIERNDLTKLAALISSGGGDQSNNDENKPDETSAVLASRLNSKFRCLSCDRPLPAIGPPGPPKLGAKGMLSVGGAGMPPSPQRYGRPASSGASKSRPGSPSNSASHADTESDVVGWGAGSSTRLNTPPGTIDGGFGDAPESPPTGARGTDAEWRRRGMASCCQSSARLEPIGANAPGEQIAGVMSRYPRMMPPPSRIRTAAGGGGAGIGSRPSSSGRF